MTLAMYPEYKATGVPWLGDVPTHWDVKRLKHGFRLVTERATQRNNPVALENIQSWSGEYISTDADFSGEGIKFQQGDVLFGKLRPYLAKAYLATSRGEAIGDFHVLRPSQGFEPQYGFYYLLNEPFISEASSVTYGAKMPRIGWDSMGSLPFLQPQLWEQRQICRFLAYETARIDALIEEQQRLIELLREKRQAVISHAVTKGLDPNVPMKDSGVEWLGEVPAHWSCMSLRHATEIYRGRFGHRPRNDPSLYDGEYAFIQTGDIARAKGYISFFQQTLNEKGCLVSQLFPAGTLVMAIAANIGDVAILNFEAYAPDSVVGFKPDSNIDIEFLRFCFIAAWPALESSATQNTQANLNVDRIGALKAVFPPKDEQIEIAEYLRRANEQYDCLREEAKKGIEILLERRAALVSAAVTGKIDVRGWKPADSHGESPRWSGQEVSA